jgi:hypothetical protein
MHFNSLGLSKNELQDERAHDSISDRLPSALDVHNRNGDRHQEADLVQQGFPDLGGTNADELGSVLPSAVERVRERISGKNDQPVFCKTPPDYIPSFGTFKFGYLPARGLIYSALAHELVLFGFFLFVTYAVPALRSEKLILRSEMQDRSRTILLPEIGGGKEGQKSPGGGQSRPQQASAASAHASKGFAYPGPQAILSDPPNPTNAFQTIQRPLLVHPEPIQKLIPLPNVVRMAETRLPNELIAPQPTIPQLHEPALAFKVKRDATKNRDAKWKAPVNDAPALMAKAEMPKLPSAEQPLPEAPRQQAQKAQEEKQEVVKPAPNPIKVTAEKRAEAQQKQASPPSAAQIARMEMHGKELEPLLSLSPMPLAPQANAKVPAGEARGRFAIAPGGTLNPNSITPGTPAGVPSISAATGQETSNGPNAATETASEVGNAKGHNPAAGGTGSAKEALGGGSVGTGEGTGNTSGKGPGGAGSGKGKGNPGNGAGSGNGRGTGTGSGAGSGSGSGSFPGITIQGGEESATGNASGYALAPETSYGMTIVSTASSGGGLEDFGVFQNEHVFTVYIPMKRAPDEEDPAWTLQYALLRDNSSEPTGDPAVLAPSPVMREWPKLAPELEKKYAEHQVVIYAIVDKEGKVSHVSVKKTPDARVSDPIAQAFAKWIFRPAQVNSRPVAVKILLGIPL